MENSTKRMVHISGKYIAYLIAYLLVISHMSGLYFVMTKFTQTSFINIYSFTDNFKK